ncbi:MAG: hypothetical protein NTW25_01480 [Candidatus Kapabacteria bacterium]|nr:hypothetical protein [Candidatus Kapabacteria bacterium]
MKLTNRLILSTLIPTLIILLNSCASIEQIDSKYAQKEIIIDGNDIDWQESFYYYPDQRIMIGFRNDENNLYVCLKSADSEVFHKVMMNGLTLWINDKEDDTKTFGIHYPIGALNEFGNFEKPRNDEERESAQNKKYDNMLYTLDLLFNDGVDKESISVLNLVRKYNVTAIIKRDNGTVIYEIAIPLKSDKININSRNSKKKIITLGFETGEIKNKQNFKRNDTDIGEGIVPGNQGMAPGGMVGGIGGRGMSGGASGRGRGAGRSGNMGGASANKALVPLKIWFDIKLAQK